MASFGFVEHFDDPAAVVDRQFGLVRGEGHVVVTMPNYARGQWLLHRLFDPAMLEGHNLRCMSRAFLVQAAIRNHATLLFADYVGGHFAFWDSGKHRKNDVSCTNCHSTHGDRYRHASAVGQAYRVPRWPASPAPHRPCPVQARPPTAGVVK